MLRRDGLSEGLGESLVSLSPGGCWIATTGENESRDSASGGNMGLSRVMGLLTVGLLGAEPVTDRQPGARNLQ